MIVNLAYDFSINFDSNITNHSFALKITPRDTPYYTVQSIQTNDTLYHTTDGYGNIISFGNIKDPHCSFDIYTRGTFNFTQSYHDVSKGTLDGIFLYESNFIRYSDLFFEFVSKIEYNSSLKVFVGYIADLIFNEFEYEKGITTADCNIDILLGCHKGVCQDFAHLMIAILRYFKIPARYVSGFVTGEGESHAWVEYFDGYQWLGIDPTHNISITSEPYIKIAHGKDASDTKMNKGVFVGRAIQNLSITASVE